MINCLRTFLNEELSNGGQIDSVYTDFEKAFDKVNHSILHSKLRAAGICGNLLRWIISYLDNRTQIVAINGFLSNGITATSGVPQGTILACTLFTIFINDLPSVLNCKNLLFADDLKIFKPIYNLSDCLSLQDDLNQLNNWCESNHLYLNIKKCKRISFTRNRALIDYDYVINNIKLERVHSIKDLGVIIDTKLNFDIHISTMVKKAYSMLGFILRCTKEFKNVDALKSLYFTQVRSILEYGSQIWNPQYKKYVNKIESI